MNEVVNMKIPDDNLEELKNIKVPDEMIEKFMEECAVDNSRLEELIKEMDEGLVDPKKREEFFELFKKSNLHMPVVLSDEWFEDIENFEPGRIRTTGENAGFNINYIKLGGDEKAVPLFTSSELMESTGLESSTIVLFMSDLANMLKQTKRYSWVLINPYTDLDVHMPLESFLGLFNEMTLEQREATDKLIFLLKTQSIKIDQNIKVVFRCEEDVMKERAVNGVFIPDIPFKASSFPDFQKELKYTNIILIPKNKRVLYFGGIVDKETFDTIIAPETEFELVEELDEFTRVWGVGRQPFYGEEDERIHKLKKITSKHIADSEFDKAMNYLNELVAIDPFDLSNWETKGYCHYELGQYDDAISCLDRVLEADPYSERTLIFKCKILDELKRWEEALEVYDKLLELNPDDIMNLYLKSADLAFLERYDEAIEYLDKAIELNPKEPQFWFTKAALLEGLNKFDEALECLNKTIELNQVDNKPLIKKGLILSYLNRFDEALECYDEALSLNPSDANLLHMVGDLYLIELGNYGEALKYYKEAIKLGHEDSMLWNNLGDIYLNTGEFEKGLECCDKALSLDSNNFNAWLTKGEIYYEMGQYDEAMKYAIKAKELDSTDLELLNLIEKIKTKTV